MEEGRGEERGEEGGEGKGRDEYGEREGWGSVS